MNADLGTWDVANVAKVDNLLDTFNGAAKFRATGVEKWKLPADMVLSGLSLGVFYGAISIPACTKWLIVRNWPETTKIRTVYSTWDSICKPGPATTFPTVYVGYAACLLQKTDEGKDKCQVRNESVT